MSRSQKSDITEVAVRGGRSIPLRYCYMEVDINLVHPNTWNYNEQDDFIFSKQGESLLEFGQVEAILVRDHPSIAGHYEIINGEHRWKKMVQLGAKTILINLLREEDGSPLDDIESRKLTIVMNELGGNPNHVDLAALIADIVDRSSDLGVEASEALRSLPYDEVQLNHLRSIAEGLSDTANSLLEEIEESDAQMRDLQDSDSQSASVSGIAEASFRMSFSSREYYRDWWKLVNSLLHELGFAGDPDREVIVDKDGTPVMTTTVIGDILSAGFSKVNVAQVAEKVRKRLGNKYHF